MSSCLFYRPADRNRNPEAEAGATHIYTTDTHRIPTAFDLGGSPMHSAMASNCSYSTKAWLTWTWTGGPPKTDKLP